MSSETFAIPIYANHFGIDRIARHKALKPESCVMFESAILPNQDNVISFEDKHLSWWPKMPEIYEYLAARSDAERIAARLSSIATELSRFSNELRRDPHTARGALPQDWLARDDLTRLLDEACNAWEKMDMLYKRIPQEKREHISSPLPTMTLPHQL